MYLTSRSLIILISMLTISGAEKISAQITQKQIDNPLVNQTNSVINNLTFGTFELSDSTGKPLSNQSFTPRSGIIILNNGAKLTGNITPHEYGYRISYNNGNQIIPFEYIKCVGESMPDIYEKLKQEVEEPTLSDNIKLAKQCHAWGYKEGVIDQLKQAVLKDENHPDIRQLADVYLPKEGSPIQQAGYQSEVTAYETPRQIAKYKELHKNAITKLNTIPPMPGLDYELSQEYSNNIQPILQSSCGNARCHGGLSSQSYHIDWIARDRPVSRKRLEDNLRSFLSQVNRTDPGLSPLVKVTQQDDGYHGSKIWKDASSMKHQQTIIDFVYKLQKEQNTTLTQSMQKLPSHQIPQLKPVPQTKPASETIRESPVKDRQVQSASHVETSEQAQIDNAWEKFQQKRTTDAFSPDEFNKLK